MENGDSKKKRTRSPAYPFIGLQEALERAKTFWEHEKKHPATVAVAMTHWGYDSASSIGFQIISALKQFGLMEDEGLKLTRKVKLTELVLRILLDERPTSKERDGAIQKAAINPPLHSELWDKYGPELPSDAQLKHDLTFDRGFNPQKVAQFIEQYKQTLEFAKLIGSDKLSESKEGKSTEVSVGDYVQWESQGGLQFPEEQGRQIVGFSQDGKWAFVEGAETGLPVDQLQLVRTGTSEMSARENVEQKPPINPFSQQSKTVPRQGQVAEAYSWELSQGVKAELRFVGGEVGPDHLMLLKRYLDIHREAIELGTKRAKMRASIAEAGFEKRKSFVDWLATHLQDVGIELREKEQEELAADPKQLGDIAFDLTRKPEGKKKE